MTRRDVAAWQVEFAIVPRRVLAAKPRPALPEVMDTAWWSAERLTSDYPRHLAAVAPLGSAPTAEPQTWGEADGNRVDVWFANGRAARMSARVDVRRLDARFGAMLLQFVRIANAVLVRRDGLVVEPIVGAFGAALRSSEAWRYATDPAASFGSYSAPDDDE
jgi:hypothetical protein